VTDQLLTLLTIDDCAGTECTLTIEGETNYEFGASSRRGFCSLDAEISFVSAVDAFGYVDIDDSDRNEAGAGEFANSVAWICAARATASRWRCVERDAAWPVVKQSTWP
jgi:hypothetical protein